MNSTFDRFEPACYVNYKAISGSFKSGTVNHIQVFFTVDEEKYAKRKTVTMVMREGTLYAIESISKNNPDNIMKGSICSCRLN